MNIINFAHKILEMQEEIEYLRGEVARLQNYERMYSDLLNTSVSHGENMMCNILNLCLTPGVVDCLEKNSKLPK